MVEVKCKEKKPYSEWNDVNINHVINGKSW